ncbi:MAG: hypothetical protein AAF197_04810 [Pseudomonadota bacterium]
MTESEFLEAINLHAGNVISGYSVYLTYVFGFIAGAYVVGVKLSKTQVVIITSIYSASSFAWMSAILTHAHSFATLVAEHPNYIPSPLWSLPWTELAGGIAFAAFLGSLYFGYDVRSNAQEGGA